MYNSGILTLTSVDIYGNTLTPGTSTAHGAGLFNDLNGTAVLNAVRVFANIIAVSDLPSAGGGIYQRGALTLIDSVVTNNVVLNGTGGGIENYFPTGILTATDSSISANNATLDGGGVRSFSVGSQVVLTNSTVLDNTTGGDGAGLAINGSSGRLAGVTLANNTADGNGGATFLEWLFTQR